MPYYELTPAYGRDYKSATEAKNAWLTGKDFQGDHQLGFRPVNISDIPKPCTVLLRYKRNTRVASVPVSADATVQAAIETKPKPVKRPSVATMSRWMMNGIAKATDGCSVEPDGTCEHGKPSWLIVEGVI